LADIGLNFLSHPHLGTPLALLWLTAFYDHRGTSMLQLRFIKSTARFLFLTTAVLLTHCTQQAAPLIQNGSLNNDNTTVCTNPTGTLTLVSPSASTTGGSVTISIGQTATWGIAMSCSGTYTARRNGTVVAQGFTQYTTYTTTYSSAMSTGSESITVTAANGQVLSLVSTASFKVGSPTTGISGCSISISPNIAVIGPLKPTATFQVTIAGTPIVSGTTTTMTTANCNYIVQEVKAVDQYQQNVAVTPAGASGNGSFGVTVGSAGTLSFSVRIADPSSAGTSTSTTMTTAVLTATPVTVALAPSCQLQTSAATVNLGTAQILTLVTAGPVAAAQIVGPTESNPVAYPMQSYGGTQSIPTPTAGTFTYKGQVRGSGAASSVIVDCPVSFTVNQPAAPTCTLTKSADNVAPGQPVTFTLTPTSPAGSVLNSYIVSINPNLDLGASGGSLPFYIPGGDTTVYAQVTGPGGTGNCSATVSSLSQQTFPLPRCPNGYVLEYCTQGQANLYCLAQGYAGALSIDVNTGTRTVSDTPCDCQLDSYYGGSLQYHVNPTACDSRSHDRCNNITCYR
jgi:hypothetical protein